MSNKSENDLQPPDWLNQSFIQSVLRQGMADDHLIIIKYNIKPAVGVGDNYSSSMFRSSLKIQSDDKTYSKSIIIKSLPKSEIVADKIREAKFFKTETEMLSVILPKMHDVLNEVSETPKLFAHCFYEQGPPNELLILEDLRESGFTGGDRFNGLDIDHCVLVMESLATLHAASAALVQRDPQIKEKLKYGFWQRWNRSKSEKIFSEGLDSISPEVDTWSNVKYSQKISKIRHQFSDMVFDATELDEERFNVISHGDLWTNNMMFKYDKEKKPICLKFVDFQISSYTSPVIDLLYFLFTSPRNDIRIKSLDFLLETYHSKLWDVCKKLNCEINYTIQDLKSEVLKKLVYGLAISVTIFPVTCAPREDALKDESRKENGNVLKGSNIFNNPRFKNALLESLPYFERHGVL